MQYIPFFFIPFILSLIITPLVRRFAIKNDLIAYPRPDRWHKHPTALLGGISIYLASIFSFFYFNLINKDTLGLFLGATLLFSVGLLDDKFHFKPHIKLLVQIISGCIVIFFGINIGLPINNTLLAIPFTLLWIIGITNAFNLLDNIDGLAAGVAVISSLVLFVSTLFFFNNPLGILGLILAGAALGFLPYNFNPAKIFMGDSGSMFLGFFLAVISITGAARNIPNLIITMLIPLFILSVPIFDTIFVMIVRKAQGRRVFEGGRDHTSHHLITLGLSPRKTVLLLYFISTVFGIIALLYSKVYAPIISIVAFLAIVILLFFGIFLFGPGSSKKRLERSQRQKGVKNNHMILNSVLFYKRRIVEVLLDFAFICIAYYSAYFLRFEGLLSVANLKLIQESLIWIILIKMSVFFIFGLYRGVWRYMGISDFLTMLKVVSMGTVVSVLFITLAFRFRNYSRTVFFTDWLILLFLITGSRFMFRIIGEFFSRIQNSERKILIYGAGDMGETVIREIKRNRSLNYNPIGFIDDDPYKNGNKIHGIPVLGSRERLKGLIKMHNIEEIIIAISSIDIHNFLEIIKICEDCGILYKKVKGILDREEIINGFNKN